MSETLYFYLKNGRAQGPISLKDIRALVKTGDLNPLDIIYKESDKKWKPLVEFPEFSHLVVEAATVKEKQLLEDHWVVLKTKYKADAPVGYEQEGPYAESVVKELLLTGKISYRDRVWKEGMKDWALIADVKKFSSSKGKEALRSKAYSDEEINVPEIEVEELIRKVEGTLPSKGPTPSDIQPAEADEEDLVKTDSTKRNKPRIRRPKKQRQTSPLKKAQKEKDQPKPVFVRQGSFTDELSAIFRGEKAFQWRRLMRWALAIFIFIGVTAGVLWVANRPNTEVIEGHLRGAIDHVTDKVTEVLPEVSSSKEASEVDKGGVPPSRPSIEPPKEELRPPEKKAVVAKPKEEKPQPKSYPKVEPTWFKVDLVGLSGKNPRLRFTSNASHHFLTTATLRAGAGETADARGYYRVLKMQWAPGEKRELELRKLGLKDGFYHLQAELEGRKASRNFFLGKRDKDFRKRLESGKKSLSYWHQKERRKLLRLAGMLAISAEELVHLRERGQKSPSTWTRDYTQWMTKWANISDRELRRLDERYPKNYVWPQHWIKLAEYKEQLGRLAKAYNEEIRKGNEVALEFNTQGLLKGIPKYREQMASLSLF